MLSVIWPKRANNSLYRVFVIFKYHFQLLSLLYMSWYCKNVRFMSALCISLNMIILIHIVQTFLLSYNLTPFVSCVSSASSSMTGGGIIVGVRDSLGITGIVGGLNDHQWYKGNDIQKCRKNEMFHILFHSRPIVDGCLF